MPFSLPSWLSFLYSLSTHYSRAFRFPNRQWTDRTEKEDSLGSEVVSQAGMCSAPFTLLPPSHHCNQATASFLTFSYCPRTPPPLSSLLSMETCPLTQHTHLCINEGLGGGRRRDMSCTFPPPACTRYKGGSSLCLRTSHPSLLLLPMLALQPCPLLYFCSHAHLMCNVTCLTLCPSPCGWSCENMATTEDRDTFSRHTTFTWAVVEVC